MMDKIELIDRAAVLDAMYDNEFQTFCPLDEVSTVIAAAPTIDAAPVRRGEWVDKSTEWGDELRCSVCGEQADYFAGSAEEVYCVREPNFCPNCGADMREEERDEHTPVTL